jgi:hypothetical protein
MYCECTVGCGGAKCWCLDGCAKVVGSVALRCGRTNDVARRTVELRSKANLNLLCCAFRIHQSHTFSSPQTSSSDTPNQPYLSVPDTRNPVRIRHPHPPPLSNPIPITGLSPGALTCTSALQCSKRSDCIIQTYCGASRITTLHLFTNPPPSNKHLSIPNHANSPVSYIYIYCPSPPHYPSFFITNTLS